jgi:hypothetical protein
MRARWLMNNVVAVLLLDKIVIRVWCSTCRWLKLVRRFKAHDKCNPKPPTKNLQRTVDVWPWRVWINSPVFVLQTRIVRSVEPLITRDPSSDSNNVQTPPEKQMKWVRLLRLTCMPLQRIKTLGGGCRPDPHCLIIGGGCDDISVYLKPGYDMLVVAWQMTLRSG